MTISFRTPGVRKSGRKKTDEMSNTVEWDSVPFRGLEDLTHLPSEYERKGNSSRDSFGGLQIEDGTVYMYMY